MSINISSYNASPVFQGWSFGFQFSSVQKGYAFSLSAFKKHFVITVTA